MVIGGRVWLVLLSQDEEGVERCFYNRCLSLPLVHKMVAFSFKIATILRSRL